MDAEIQIVSKPSRDRNGVDVEVEGQVCEQLRFWVWFWPRRRTICRRSRAQRGILEVKGQMTLKDDTAEVRVYNISNPHVQGFFLAHVVASNILYLTDLISPRSPIARSEGTAAAGEAMRKLRITGATIAGGHGTTAKQADIASTLAAN